MADTNKTEEQRKAHSKAVLNYKKRAWKRIPLDVPIAEYDQIKSAADAVGEYVNEYIRKAIKTRMDQESGNI